MQMLYILVGLEGSEGFVHPFLVTSVAHEACREGQLVSTEFFQKHLHSSILWWVGPSPLVSALSLSSLLLHVGPQESWESSSVPANSLWNLEGAALSFFFTCVMGFSLFKSADIGYSEGLSAFTQL